MPETTQLEWWDGERDFAWGDLERKNKCRMMSLQNGRNYITENGTSPTTKKNHNFLSVDLS